MDDAQPRIVSYEEMGEMGVIQEVNRLVLHPVGLALGRNVDGTIILLEDPDPEGWTFETDLGKGGVDLGPGAVAFAERRARYHGDRLDALGFVVQPIQ